MTDPIDRRAFEATMGAIDRLQRSSAGKEAVASAREKERTYKKYNFHEILANALGKRIPETKTVHKLNTEGIEGLGVVETGKSGVPMYLKKKVPVNKKEAQEEALQKLYGNFGVTQLTETPEGTPVIYFENVKDYMDAVAWHSSVPGDEEKGFPKIEYIGMPAERFGISPEQRLTNQGTYQHERGHNVKHHEGKNQDIPWEYRPEELEADKFALEVLKRNLKRAGIKYTPAIGTEYLLSTERPFRGEVVQNPSKGPFVDSFDYLPVSTPEMKQMVTDVYGRPSIQEFTDPEKYLEVRTAEALKNFAKNPVTYMDAHTGEKKLHNFQYGITRSKLAAGVDPEDILIDSFKNEPSIFKTEE